MTPLPTASQVYQRLVRVFDVEAQQPSAREFFIEIGGLLARIRCTSSDLHEKLIAPLAHTLASPGAADPCFTLDWIDASGLDPSLMALPWQPQRVSAAQETSEYADGPFLFTAHGDAVLTALNAARRRTVATVGNPRAWPPDHYHQSIFIALYQQARDHGLYLIHAAAVGIGGRAVLLTGASGSGKTTTMLSCIRHGFDFYSDDATLLQCTAGGALEVVSLLGVINATPQTLAWFPELEPAAAATANRTGKRLALVDAAFPGQAARRGEVAAILVPEITGQPGASLAPIGRGEVLNAVLPFSLDLHDPAAAGRQLDFLLNVVETTPCFRLRLGSDLADTPRFLAQHFFAR